MPHPDLSAPIDLPAADRLRRFAAAVMDEGVLFGVAGALGWVFGGTVFAIGGLLSTLQDTPYGGGTSVGRRITGQVLVDARGQECSHGRGIARNAIRAALWVGGCGVPLLADIGLVLIHPKGRTLADLILGTQVVDRAWAIPRADQLEGRAPRLLGG